VTYDTNPHAPTAGQPSVADRTRPVTGAVRPDGQPGGDDALINLAGVVLAALAVLTLATSAAFVAVVAYGFITWRRTRWWLPILLGLTGALVAVAALGGPAPALDHHLPPLAS
jgi:hypothetical protein